MHIDGNIKGFTALSNAVPIRPESSMMIERIIHCFISVDSVGSSSQNIFQSSTILQSDR